MENGAIVEQGTHEELLARGGAFARLHNAQFVGAATDAAVDASALAQDILHPLVNGTPRNANDPWACDARPLLRSDEAGAPTGRVTAWDYQRALRSAWLAGALLASSHLTNP